MLDAFIIEEIRRREREAEDRREQQRPRIEIPIHQPPPRREKEEPGRDRGVVIIDYAVNSYGT